MNDTYTNNVDESIEPIYYYADKSQPYEDNSLFSISGNMYDEMHIKIAFLLFIIFCIINTDIFAEHVLGRLSKKNYDRVQDKVSERGILVGGIFMSASYLVIDLLNKRGFV